MNVISDRTCKAAWSLMKQGRSLSECAAMFGVSTSLLDWHIWEWCARRHNAQNKEAA